MIKERIPISGDLGSKVKQLMEYAGWYEGRSVDISIAEQYYADHGVPMMKTTQRFYRKYFGLCCEWYLAQKKLKWAADFEFALFPYLVNGIKNHLEDAYFRDMSGCELAEIEQAAGEKCQPIGHIGYYYPAEVWISEYGKLYAKTLIWRMNLIRCLTSSCWMSCPRGMTQKADAPFPCPVWRLPGMAPAENTTCWKMALLDIIAAKVKQAVWPRAWTISFP